MLSRTKPLVAGIDANSYKIAVAIGDGKYVELVTGKFPQGPDKRPRTLAMIHEFTASLIAQYPNIRRIGLEKPLMGRSGVGSTIPQAMASGALQAAVGTTNIPINLVDVPHWKKVILGKGTASKDEIGMFVKTTDIAAYERCVLTNGKIDEDLCDAYCIYLYALSLDNVYNKLTNIQRRRNAAKDQAPVSRHKGRRAS